MYFSPLDNELPEIDPTSVSGRMEAPGVGEAEGGRASAATAPSAADGTVEEGRGPRGQGTKGVTSSEPQLHPSLEV